ncbi:hypothetical protein RX11_00208, partial [Escherichia coli]
RIHRANFQFSGHFIAGTLNGVTSLVYRFL